MITLVVKMGIIPTGEGDAFGLLAMLPGGLIDVRLGSSWAAAAKEMAKKLKGPVTCDETVGGPPEWKVVTPTRAERLYAASIAVGISSGLVVKDETLAAFCSAWCAFFKLRLWEQVETGVGLPTLRRERETTTEQVIAILGQSGIEYGLAFYEKPSDFVAVMSGEPVAFSGLSVLATDESGLGPAFAPLGVPPPQLTRIVARKAKAPGLSDFMLATALRELLVGVVTGEVRARTLSPGVTIELKRKEPKPPKPKRTKKR